MQFAQSWRVQFQPMLQRLLKSPLLGAVGTLGSWLWTAFWLVGPPIGLTTPNDSKSFVLWGMVALLCSAGQSFYALHRKASIFENKLKEIEEAKPHVKLKEPGAVHSSTVLNTFIDKHTGSVIWSGEVPFLCVAFKNDPPHSFPGSIAKGVRAYVDFFPIGQSVPVLRMDGRWSESSQPPMYSQFESKAPLLETTFGIGESRSVDIAHISGVDGKCYAWNNDNYNNFDAQYVTPKHLLQENSYEVQVRLRGEFVDETIKFTFEVTPKGFKFTQPF